MGRFYPLGVLQTVQTMVHKQACMPAASLTGFVSLGASQPVLLYKAIILGANKQTKPLAFLQTEGDGPLALALPRRKLL